MIRKNVDKENVFFIILIFRKVMQRDFLFKTSTNQKKSSVMVGSVPEATSSSSV